MLHRLAFQFGSHLIARCLPATLGCILLLVATLPVVAQQSSLAWPQRHGPQMNGHANPSKDASYPTAWDEASDKNILWKVEIDEFGHSTPVVGMGKIWLTSATKDGQKQFVHCYDDQTGDLIYKKLISENESPEPLGNDINTYASPTSVLTEDGLYVHFGTYATAKLEPETGEIIWARRDIECRHFRGPGSSPVLIDSVLILTFDGIDQQFLTGLDTETGETKWRTDRTTDYGDLDDQGQPFREGDMRKAYSTPGLVKVGDRWQVVSVGSRAAFGYDALTGKEIWTLRHDDFNAAAPPVFYENFVILNTGSRQANLTAVKLDDTTQGDITESHVAWDIPRGNSRFAAPLLANGRIYMVNDSGVLRCVSAADGEIVWQDRVSGNFVASPILAEGNIYFGNEEGETYLVEEGDSFKLLGKCTLKEGMRASPAAGNGAIYLRTFHHLYKVGNKG